MVIVMVYNISYDLHNPGQKYKKLHELIVEVSNNRWAHILNSTYVIQSYKNANEIYNYLSNAIDENDLIFICEITKNMQGVLKNEHWPYISNLF
ncbi:hypothetical protein FDF29_09725 [Clostridium botulinum]|uniref:Hypothetical phage protein n=2 Tax=Clostridium botulinum TaxID=1491 RepID=A5I4G2_CLOBH|nr:hypothetical protein [Clostridium botulinum]NFQ54169.1 hypothetical protein [Clostridium botulinum]NFT46528.1 hypothetical protein [Clostridium botulinum]CAL83934.1 hypothetical phage protein [Clostridium botulinum A str. ATCC 3502]